MKKKTHKIEFTRNAQSKNNLIMGGSGCGKARCFDVSAHNSLTEIGKNFANKNRKSNTQEKE